VLTLGSNYVLVQIKFFVSEFLPYSQSLPGIGLCLVMKFVIMR